MMPAKNPYKTLWVNKKSMIRNKLHGKSGIKHEAKIDPAKPKIANTNIFIGPN